VKEEEERTRTTTVMYALLLYSKNWSSFCSIRALFTFSLLFWRRESRGQLVRLLCSLEKTEKQKKNTA